MAFAQGPDIVGGIAGTGFVSVTDSRRWFAVSTYPGSRTWASSGARGHTSSQRVGV